MPPESKPDTPPFEAPEVLLGDTVLWSSCPGDREAYPAVVTAVGSGGAVAVNILFPGGRSAVPKEAVLHQDDPERTLRHDPESGVWRLTERAIRLAKVLESIQDGIEQLVGPVDLSDVRG